MEAVGSMVLWRALPTPAGSAQPDTAHPAGAAHDVGREEGRVGAEV